MYIAVLKKLGNDKIIPKSGGPINMNTMKSTNKSLLNFFSDILPSLSSSEKSSTGEIVKFFSPLEG